MCNEKHYRLSDVQLKMFEDVKRVLTIGRSRRSFEGLYQGKIAETSRVGRLVVAGAAVIAKRARPLVCSSGFKKWAHAHLAMIYSIRARFLQKHKPAREQ